MEELLTIAFDRPLISEFMSVEYANREPHLGALASGYFLPVLCSRSIFPRLPAQGFAASFLGPIGAVAATSGLWAVLHTQYGLYDIAIIFCLGLLFGAARLVTGSLFVPLTLHAVTNLLATVEVALLR